MTDAGDRTAPESYVPPVRRATHRSVAEDETIDDTIDDATAISARRAEPADHATEVSVRRDAPLDDGTRLSTRRAAPTDDATRTPAQDVSPATSPAEPETVVDDTILRPLRRSTAQPAGADEPAGDAAQPHRAAYVPTAADFADRRAPRAPQVAVASRTHAPSPRSLEGSGDDVPTAAPRRERRLRAQSWLLIIAAAVFAVAILTAVALTLLPT